VTLEPYPTKYHVPFWRAVEGVTPSLTLILSRYVPLVKGELKPVDKKVPTPLDEAGSKHRIAQ